MASARGTLDLYLIYEFLRRLVKPFRKWDAYKEGVIDQNGKVIVDKEDRTPQQKKVWGYYDRLIANLKKLLGKIPGGRSRIANFAAALLLLKENNLDPDDMVYLSECLDFYLKEAELLVEDTTNVAGQGNIAGIGVGPKGEPGVHMDRYQKDIMRRKKKMYDQILKVLKNAGSDN